MRQQDSPTKGTTHVRGEQDVMASMSCRVVLTQLFASDSDLKKQHSFSFAGMHACHGQSWIRHCVRLPMHVETSLCTVSSTGTLASGACAWGLTTRWSLVETAPRRDVCRILYFVISVI